MKTVNASGLAVMLFGCVAMGAYAGGCANDDLSSSDPVAVVRSTSPKPFASKSGNVTSWKFYNEGRDKVRVLGEDSGGKVIAELLLSTEENSDQQAQKVTVETIRPERSSVWFKRSSDGKAVIEKSTDKEVTSQHVFDTLEEDARSYSSAADQGPYTLGLSWACVRATLAMVGACGATAATCVETAGVGCALGGAGCLATVGNYYHECD